MEAVQCELSKKGWMDTGLDGWTKEEGVDRKVACLLQSLIAFLSVLRKGWGLAQRQLWSILCPNLLSETHCHCKIEPETCCDWRDEFTSLLVHSFSLSLFLHPMVPSLSLAFTVLCCRSYFQCLLLLCLCNPVSFILPELSCQLQALTTIIQVNWESGERKKTERQKEREREKGGKEHGSCQN